MSKKMKKLCCIGLTAMVACSTIMATGCGGASGNSGNSDSQFENRYDDEAKKEMTQLTVGVYKGGLGYAWAQELAKIFEEKYKDVSFEEGKKGVYVSIQPKKLEYEATTLISNMQGGVENADVYIVSGNTMKEYLEGDVALNITSALTENAYDENGEVTFTVDANGKAISNGTQSILDRIDPYFADAYNYGTDTAPTYYHLPYEWGIRGFVYDHDLFEEEGWLTYSGYDGVPKTTTEFLDLLGKIEKAGYYGYTMSPNDAGFYTHDYGYAFLAQYEGEDEALLNLTYDGVATFAANTFDAATVAAEGINVATDGTQSVTITEANAWLLSQQTGKKEYVNFLRQVINSKYFDPNVIGQTQSFTEAQKSFILSCTTGTRIAMLFDGEWWENEAKTQFESMGKRNPAYGYGKRDFRFMPVPQAAGGVNEKQSFAITGAGPCFVNKKTQHADLATKWVQMVYSVTGCKTVLKNTGMTLPMDFTMSQEELNGITPFARSTYNIKKSDDIKVYTVSTEQKGVNAFALNGEMVMTGYGRNLSAKAPMANGSEANQNNVFTYFLDNLSFTADKWMEGSASLYSKADWTAAYNKYFN